MQKKTNENLVVTPAPHLAHKDSVYKIQWIVFLSLVPACAWGVYVFGLPALRVLGVAILSCMAVEVIFNWLRKTPVTVWDGSAAVTGILLGMVLPPYVPLYIVITASVFAIGIVKHLFGGLGFNVMNPALSGRVFVMFCWIGPLTAQKYYLPRLGDSFFLNRVMTDMAAGASNVADAIGSATPMTLLKGFIAGKKVDLPSGLDLAIGKVSGSIGEISAVFLILGALWLFKRKYITWHIPLTFLGSAFVFTFLYALIQKINLVPDYSSFKNAVVFAYLHLVGGGLILGAFFMATDMVSTPLTRKGQVLIGLGAGIVTCLIRLFGGYPEGVMFAILLMELVGPLVDHFSKPKIYGWDVENEA